MVISCPECGLQVSDKAFACPHCGYPMKQYKSSIHRQRKNKRRRLPNGFGQIYEVKNRNLRKPFRASVTIGFKENGRPIVQALKPESYFTTYNEAYAALMEYHKNPYDIDAFITVKEFYETIWFDHHCKNLSETAVRKIKAAWKYCEPIYDVRMMDLRPRHMECCIDDGFILNKDGDIQLASSETKKRMKSIFNLMFDYACKNDITQKNYARAFKLPKEVLDELDSTDNAHKAFTEEELCKIWNYSKTKDEELLESIELVLAQCYGGWRPQELGLIKIKNVDLDNNLLIGGIKNDNGKNREVPIHPKIKYIIEKYYNHALSIGSEFLFNVSDDTKLNKKSVFGTRLTYKRYRDLFYNVTNTLELDPDHKPHDGRKTFVTMAKNAEVNEYALKRIVGHSVKDITEKTYTDRPKDWLFKEIQKIK